MTYEHQSAMCPIDNTTECFDQLSKEGWEYVACHVVPMSGQSLLHAAPVVVPHVFSIWRRVKTDNPIQAAVARLNQR